MAAVAELSLASRTGLFELGTRARLGRGSEYWVRTSARPNRWWPGPRPDRAGPDVPAILEGAVLTVAGHDHQTAAYGVGAAIDGALFDSLGTAEGLVRTVRAPLPASASAGSRHTVSRWAGRWSPTTCASSPACPPG